MVLVLGIGCVAERMGLLGRWEGLWGVGKNVISPASPHHRTVVGLRGAWGSVIQVSRSGLCCKNWCESAG